MPHALEFSRPSRAGGGHDPCNTRYRHSTAEEDVRQRDSINRSSRRALNWCARELSMDEVVKEFLIESYENLNQLDHDLVELEKDPHSKDLLGSVFRTIHSIKGVSGFLDFPKLEAVTHAAEELLSKLRDGELVLDQEITSVLLATVDSVRQMLAKVEADGTDGDQDYPELVGRLARICSPEAGATESAGAGLTLEAPEIAPPRANEPEPVPAQPAAPSEAVIVVPKKSRTVRKPRPPVSLARRPRQSRRRPPPRTQPPRPSKHPRARTRMKRLRQRRKAVSG